MVINCNITKSDNKAFRRFVHFRLQKIHWFFASIVIVLLVFVWFSNEPDATLRDKIAGQIGVIVTWCVIMAIGLGLKALFDRISGGRFQGSVGPHTFEITSDAIIETNANGRQETRVAGLKRVAETDSHFFVITKTGVGYVIPKRDLQSFDDLHALQKQVQKQGER